MGTTVASYTHESTGTNNSNLRFEAVQAGPDGNDVTITLVDPNSNGASLSVSASGNDVTVNLATDGSGNITTTADDIVTAIEGNTAASAVIKAVQVQGDGSGVVEALSQTSLSGGAYTIEHLYQVDSTVYVIESFDCGSNSSESGIAVQKGRVIRVHSEVLVNSTGADNLRYDVRIDGRSGTVEFKQEDVFKTKSAAVTEYETRIS